MLEAVDGVLHRKDRGVLWFGNVDGNGPPTIGSRHILMGISVSSLPNLADPPQLGDFSVDGSEHFGFACCSARLPSLGQLIKLCLQKRDQVLAIVREIHG